MRHFLLVVEGQHDSAVVGRLLKDVFGMDQVRKKEGVPPHFARLIPTKFPYKGDLLRRVPVPAFWRSDERAVAIAVAESDSQLLNSAHDTLQNLGFDINGVGFVVDADERPASHRWTSLKDHDTKGLFTRLDFGAGPGQVGAAQPTAGVFVAPNNVDPGTIEDLLLQCGAVAYPTLSQLAAQWVHAVAADSTALPNECDAQEFRKPAGHKKAQLAAMGAMLKPGKAIQMSVQDQRWLEPSARAAAQLVGGLEGFLRQLLA